MAALTEMGTPAVPHVSEDSGTFESERGMPPSSSPPPQQTMRSEEELVVVEQRTQVNGKSTYRRIRNTAQKVISNPDHETVRVEMSADYTIDEVYYNGQSLSSKIRCSKIRFWIAKMIKL